MIYNIPTVQELKQNTVDIPELPTMNTNLPDLEKQLEVALPFVTAQSVVIGHSLGALLAMRLAEKNSTTQ